MKSLAIIPARKGSKGVPGKNTRALAGKPLVAYTFDAALAVPGLEIFVTTDDDTVIDIARAWGIEVRYRRPPHLANDVASMVEVVMDALVWLETRSPLPEAFVLLQPTSLFRTAGDIRAGMDLLAKTGAPSVIGVSPMWTHPFECVEVDGDRWRQLAIPAGSVTRRQDYAERYHYINGALYCVRTQEFLRNRAFLTPESKLLVMDDINTVDIDTERDWTIAEALVSKRLKT